MLHQHKLLLLNQNAEAPYPGAFAFYELFICQNQFLRFKKG
jgi:hypothetical protein